VRGVQKPTMELPRHQYFQSEAIYFQRTTLPRDSLRTNRRLKLSRTHGRSTTNNASAAHDAGNASVKRFCESVSALPATNASTRKRHDSAARMGATTSRSASAAHWRSAHDATSPTMGWTTANGESRPHAASAERERIRWDVQERDAASANDNLLTWQNLQLPLAIISAVRSSRCRAAGSRFQTELTLRMQRLAQRKA
jgi:hypothetical protein